MKKTIFLFLVLFLYLQMNAQENNDEKQKIQAAIADKFPSTRVLDFQYLQYLPADYDSKLLGQDFQSGQIKAHSKFKVAANIPVYSKSKWNITSSFNYKYEGIETRDVKDNTGIDALSYDRKYDFHYLSAAVSFTYFSILFKKPFIYNISIFADGTEKDVERIKGFVGGSLVLKATANTKMTVGLLVFIDPASPLPLTPTFTYEHKFQNSPWTLDFILPQRLLFKRDVFKNGRLSIGSELTSDGFYIYNTNPGYPSVYDYRQLEVRSGITYEHRISNAIIATFKTGMANVFNSRITERGESTTDYIFSSKQDATGYFNLGISFNPFVKKK